VTVAARPESAIQQLVPPIPESITIKSWLIDRGVVPFMDVRVEKRSLDSYINVRTSFTRCLFITAAPLATSPIVRYYVIYSIMALTYQCSRESHSVQLEFSRQNEFRQ
jgi:hypothetical protein